MRKQIDREMLKQKIDDLSSSKTSTLTPEEASQLLDERAEKLSESFQNKSAQNKLDLLVFDIGPERYGIELKYVKEVRKASLTPLPGTSRHFRGITSLRGEVLAVIDLHFSFNVASPALTHSSQLVVLGEDKIEFGLLTASPPEIMSLENNALLSAADLNAGTDYACGITETGVIIIDGKKLLTDPKFYLNQE